MAKVGIVMGRRYQMEKAEKQPDQASCNQGTLRFHDRIVFFDFDGNHVKMCRFGDKTLQTTSSPDNPLYYYSCFASDKYVYAVYRESKKDTDETNPLYLEQFDWDGNPVARYSLPKGRGLYTGCATEDNSIIYMVDYYEDNFLHKIVLSKD